MKTCIFILACLALASATAFDRFSGTAYQSQTAKQKMDQLWTEITANQVSHPWHSGFQVAKIFFNNMKTTFDTYSDVIPEGRKKLIHSVGCVAQAEFVVEKENPYTGMFKGASEVLIRISTAKEPSPSKPAKDTFTPGMGIKLLRDKVPSANLVAMLAVEGHDSWNPFKFDWSNHIPDPKAFGLRLLGRKFAQATPFIGRIGLKTWAKFNQQGQLLDDSQAKFPFKLIFSPSSEVRNRFPETYSDLLTNQLKTIPAGTAIHDIYAVENPGDAAIKIGTIRTKSKFVTSDFGDNNLFFQHNYIEDDIMLHPNWEQAVKVNPPLMATLMKEFH